MPKLGRSKLIAIFFLAACSSDPQVDRQNYSTEVQDRIDAAAQAKNVDCNILEAEYKAAKANDTAQEARARDGNADLMAYINARAEEAGCFPEGSSPFS
jgi:post-segregation antitoxin (ccd killing protein)